MDEIMINVQVLKDGKVKYHKHKPQKNVLKPQKNVLTLNPGRYLS